MRPKLFFLTAALMGVAISTHAQLSGTYAIPGAYATIAAAVTALNASGVSGPVIFNISAGYTETAPAGGLLLGSSTLNATLNATNTLKFNRSGTGANPRITAPAGTSTTADVLFAMSGTDYVTINGIDLQESSGNTTPTTVMEVGYGLYNLNAAAPFDGCNNVTIQNCTITMNRSVATVSKAIQAAHYLAGTTTALTLTATGDLHSNNKYYGNTITNTVGGIYLIGYAAATPYTLYDQNNDVGGATAATGNTITNFLGANYTNIYGVYGTNQNNLNVSNNTLDQLANGGVSSVGTVYGINTSGINSTFTFSNNTISLSEAPIGTTYYVYGIFNGSAGTTITATNNKVTTAEPAGTYANNYGLYFSTGTNLTVTGCRVTQTNTVGGTTANTGTTYGIYSSANGTVNISTDTITQTTGASTNAPYYSIYAVGAATTETIQNNVFLNSNVTSNGAAGTMGLIYTSNATPNKTISGNLVSGTITHTSSVSVPTYGIVCSPSAAPGAGTATFTGNNFSGISASGGQFFGISCAQTVASSQALVLTNNTFSGISGTTAGLYGIYFSPSVATTQNVTINGNTFSGFTNNSAFAVGIFTNSGNNLTVSGNTISGFTTSGAGDVYGIYHAGTTTAGTTTLSKNKIYDLQSGGTAALGITVAGGVTTAVVNNLIGNLRAPASTSTTADRVIGINVSSTQANSAVNVYYNTVYLAASSSGTDFSTSALFHVASTTATTAALDLRNNILVNTSTPAGTGIAAALHRSAAGGTNFAAVSDRNLLYAGTPGTAQLLYTDGTTSAQSLAEYRGALAPTESNSVTENVPFASTSGSSANFLHLTPGVTTMAESRGINIAGITTDFDGTVRQGNPSYTGTGTAPDLGAGEGQYSYSVPLAIRLIAFSGSTQGRLNTLQWEAAVETPTDGFDLERSADGRAFTRIATLAARGKVARYSYADPQAGAGLRYYRLKLTGQPEGSDTYSNMVVLSQTRKDAGTITASPNPAHMTTTLHLTAASGDAAVELLDATGRRAWSTHTAASTVEIDMSQLAPGSYFIRVVQDGEITTGSVVKN